VSVDADGADSVTVGFNTYAAGQDIEDVFSIESTHDDDDINPSLSMESQNGNLENILATGQYPMELDRQGFDNIDNDNADTIGDLEIQDRSVNAFNVWTTSNEVFDEVEDEEDILNGAENGTVLQRSDIAVSDADGDVSYYESKRLASRASSRRTTVSSARSATPRVLVLTFVSARSRHHRAEHSAQTG